MNPIHAFLRLTLALVILLAPGSPLTAQEAAAPAEDLEQQAFEIGKEAFVYGLPLVNLYLLRQRHLENQRVNELVRREDPVDPRAAQLIAPNAEVLYCTAWIDLRHGPVVLSVPRVEGRYFSFQAIELYGDNQVYAGTRTHAGELLHFAYIPPDWDGKLPSGVQRIDCYSTALLLVGRTYFSSADDLPAARALQEKYTLTVLDKAAADLPPVTYPRFELSDLLSFYAILDEGLRENPPPHQIAEPLTRFRKLGIGGETPFDLAALDPSVRRGLERGLHAGGEEVARCRQDLARKSSGWRYLPWHIGLLDSRYCERAAVASVRLGLNSPAECLYLACREDQQGQLLDGGRRYRLRFPKEQLPPARAFWSLTVYHWPEISLAPNPLNRLSLRSTDENLRFEEDGSLVLSLQNTSPDPADDGNWVPTPEGNFQVVLRVYDPHLQPLKNGWTPPVVELVE